MSKKKKNSGEITPNLKDFKKLTKTNNLIVFSRKFFSDGLTPIAVYYKLSKFFKGESFLLESVEGEEKVCHFSFLGFKPLCVFKSKGKKVYLKYEKTVEFAVDKSPLDTLKKITASFKVAPKENLRFFGGFVGYLGYDIIRFYENIGKNLPDSLGDYDAYFILPKFLVIFDHRQQQIELLYFSMIKDKNKASRMYASEKEYFKDFYNRITKPVKLPDLAFSRTKLKMKSNFPKKGFIAAVNKVKQHIKKGDIIQAVISQRFSCNFKADPFMAYRYLRTLNPSPYMFYLNFNDLKLAGSSPEMLLRCEEGTLITHPIAGTRKRGSNEAEDCRLEKELLKDPKERAEHIMLVDLARNDLGRVAKQGSVKVPLFMQVEKFSHVMHIVSEVRAKINNKTDIFTALASCFPAGTVSGAPKIRAMQIINDLEPDKRGIYAGSVGYFSFTNSLDTCIIIRTIIFKNNKAYIQAGAGIVADSKPEKEYQETLNKARAQLVALELAK
ncbi:MAG: anthranilate synthase component I [Candidatus Omnitrophica bacterium]|jgi:anthranilate synthase component 1|nr:anthranilate synthase component I [Candidatus Omnitrophota bacterium]